MKLLAFEKPIIELYEKIEELKRLSSTSVDLGDEIKRIEARALLMKKEIFSNLTPLQILQIARHPNRPTTLGLANLIFDDFLELHGDRQFRDDPSIVGGLARLGTQRLVVIGHQKGLDTKDNIYRNFGMPHPEGYRKALRLMQMAQKFGLAIVTFVDTPGAYPGLGAEERGQAEAIARNLKEMALLAVPILTVVVGEGGSGGALGIAVANRLYMLEYAVYSVISPEGCASILYHDASKAEEAASSLRITAGHVLELGLADEVIQEPLGGCHNDWGSIAASIKKVLQKDLTTYKQKPGEEIVNERYSKFRHFGPYIEL